MLGVRIPPGLPIEKGQAPGVAGAEKFPCGFSYGLHHLGSIMARLQRKKDLIAKKKKKNAAVDASPPASNDDAVKKTALPVVTLKRQTLPQKKALAKTWTEPGKIKSYLNTSIQFLREVKVELKKVTWPTRKQEMGSTVVVIILVVIISLFLGVVDIGLSSLIRVVFQ